MNHNSSIGLLLALMHFTFSTSAAEKPGAESRKAVAIVVSGIAKSDINPDGISFSDSRKKIQEAEVVLAECIARKVSSRHSHLRVVMPRDFYHLAFPALTSDEAPRSLESMEILLQDSSFRARLMAAGVVHLVVAGGATERRYRSGAVQPFGVGGPLGPGIIWLWGTVVWDHDSHLAAYVIDLAREATPAQVKSIAKDESRFGIYVYLPVGSLSRAHLESCTDLGEKVADSLIQAVPLGTQH